LWMDRTIFYLDLSIQQMIIATDRDRKQCQNFEKLF